MTTHISKRSCDYEGCRKATNVENTLGWVHLHGSRQGKEDLVVQVVEVDYCPDHASAFDDLDWKRP